MGLLRTKLVGFGLLALFFIYFVLTSLYPELLWFDSFSYGHIWLFVLRSKVFIFLGAFLLAFLWLYFNLRVANKYSKLISEGQNLEFNTPFKLLNQFLYQVSASSQSRQQPLPGRLYNVALLIGAIIISSFFGLVAKAWWQDVYAYFYQTPFLQSDPIFNKDISFYVFSLPFFQHIQSWFMALFVVSLGFVSWVYFSKNILLIIFSKQRHGKYIKKHILILLALLIFVFACGKWLSLYDLLFDSRSVVFIGTGYTDHHILIPALKVLTVLFFLQSIFVLLWAFTSFYKIPLLLFAAIFLVQLIGVQLLPNLIQNYIVKPNEMEREKPYIENNIKLTRAAYGLDKIQDQEFLSDDQLSIEDVRNNDGVVRNIRLWNQGPLKQTFSQLQEIRLYYEFENVDVDRYMVNGNMQQVMLSGREMDVNQLPKQTWINRHLSFTHGYGVCMTPVNEISDAGLPKFYLKDLPTKSSIPLEVTRPEIYFGEKTLDYIIVNTKHEEFDYPKGDKNVYTRYAGKGGVLLDSFIKRFVFSLKFSDFKILFSSLISDESRIVFDRHIKQIARRLAPFLIFDRDPYLVVTQSGRLVWIQDAYTYSDRFPYSEPDPFYQQVNYIRNAVKITIDAYSGETHFYVVDDKDPVIQTYSKIYAGMFKSFSEMPDSLKQHVRYPKDLFTLQAKLYASYHMTDSNVFYNREDLWTIPKEKQSNEELEEMSPYYMVSKLPGDEKESFILMLPFTPTNKNNMIGWMSAKCDLDDYGQIKVYKLPKKRTIYGPLQIESRIDQDTRISQKLTLWGQVGSRVIRGNLMVVPIENSLVYVEPIYLQATQSKLPELKRVIFSYKDKIVMERNLESAIEKTFDASFSFSKGGASSSKETVSTVEDVVSDLVTTFKKFKQSAKDLKWSDLGDKLSQMDRLIDMIELKMTAPKKSAEIK